MKYLACITSSLVLCAAVCGCSANRSSPRGSGDVGGLDEVVLMLNWYPEAEHGGFYAAEVHGIFERYGLDVTIQPGGPNAPVAQELVAGRVQFAVGNADDVLLFQQQDAEVVALLAPIQNTPRCILVREESAVMDLKSLAGLRLQANAGRPFLDFMKSQGLLENVQVVPYSGTVANFVADENTAIQAYSFSEPLLAQQQGVQVRKLMLSDVGFNPYASCLVSTGDFIAENEDLVSRMVIACREGWEKYLNESVETNKAIVAVNAHGMTTEALEFGVGELKPLCIPEGSDPNGLGTMTESRWSQLIEQFSNLGLVEDSKVTVDKVFTNQFANRSSAVE